MDRSWHVHNGVAFFGAGPGQRGGSTAPGDDQLGVYLGKYEVTQGQWQAVMGSNPSYSGSSRTVENVSWNDVQVSIQKLNQAAGSELYGLPTEAEWEYAWYGGNNSPSGTKDVGTKKASPWGLHDMHGNVYEWCQDWYGSYSSNALSDPMGPSTGSNRVHRGGHFVHSARNVRSADRGSDSPGNRCYYLGFRLLRRGQ